jgi:hypothetical protein
VGGWLSETSAVSQSMLPSDVTSVNVFYRINQLPVDPNQERARAVQEREFMIGSIGVWFFFFFLAVFS